MNTNENNIKEKAQNAVNMARCNWVIEQAEELKALFSYNSDRMIELNKVRALASIDAAMSALSLMKASIESVEV